MRLTLPAGGTSWWDQVVGPAGGTSWWDQLTGLGRLGIRGGIPGVKVSLRLVLRVERPPVVGQFLIAKFRYGQR